MTVAPLRSALFSLLFLTAAGPALAADGYVGASVCGSCHKAELELWRGSDHDRAMEEATEKTILGNFHAAQITARGVASTFSQKSDVFSVQTQGPDGKPGEYRIAYTFGVDPLQQYLVTFADGAYQALTTAWDTRAQKAGGQRWFDLYPNEKTPPGDVLHWTGPANNWNRMCADCHSTNVRTKYTLADKRYETTWSEIDVACESCHGPGERHVRWARAKSDGTPMRARGHAELVVDLHDSTSGAWGMSGDTGIAHLDKPRTSRNEIETCAPCHSRRSKIGDAAPGQPFLDAYRPALLDEGLYFSDGQMQDEVYEWGSFLQSRMFNAGVTCGDCHDPHSLRLRAQGNGMCAKCHAPAKFDTPQHHHHARASRAALCVECHMPSRTYMQIDQRRDHSFRVPRPDLSAAVGAPNPCSTCHENRTPEWASADITGWNGGAPRPHFANAIHSGRRLGRDAGRLLTDLIRDRDQPPIARATALELLPGFAVEDSLTLIPAAASDSDALVRAAAAAAAGRLPLQVRPVLIQRLLEDRVRLVRLEAARSLAPARSQLTGKQAEAFDRALAEYEAAQTIHADQPQAHVNLGALYAELGRPGDAARSYQTAIDVGPYFIPAYVNLADVHRARGEDGTAETTLRKGLERAADDASLHHSLGLTQVRLGRKEEALAELRRAHELAPDDGRYAYVYGVALSSLGQRDAAIATLKKAYEQHPADVEIAAALASIERDAGNVEAASEYARRIAAEWPNSQAAKQLVANMVQAGP